LLFALAHLAHHLVTSLPEPLGPLIADEFSLNEFQAGWMISAFNISYGLGQLPAGWLADRIGPRTLITIGICGVALVGFIIGIPQSYPMLIALLVLLGLMGGGYHPSAIPLISASVNWKVRGRALGLHQIGGSSSFFLVPLIAAAIASAWNWRGSFIGLSIPTMIFGIVLYILLVRKKDNGGAQAAEEGHDEEPSGSTPLKTLVAFIILSTFTHIVAHSVKAFIPFYMVEHFNWSEATSGTFMSIFYSTGILVSLLGGYLSDRFGAVRVVVIISLIGGVAIYLLDIAPNAAIVGVITFIIGMVVHMRMVASSAYIVSKTPLRHKSTVIGIYFALMQSNSALALVTGWFINRWGYSPTFIISAASTVIITIICAMFLRGSGNKRRVATLT
jgi:FSR family fosmidomycin resistance protein-like MFS transporter